MPAITFQFDYSRDTFGFFNAQLRRDVLELAGQALGNRLNDNLLAVIPNGGDSWSIHFPSPSGSGNVTINNPTIPENTILVYAGARDIGALAYGGPGSYSAPTAGEGWNDLIAARGQVGALESFPIDFGPWGGSITFDTSRNWYFGASTGGQGSTQQDFYSVALHELGHVLGVGTSESWDQLVGGRYFVGPHTRAAYDAGPTDVPLSPDQAHFLEGLEDDGQEAAMDPSLLQGTRKVFTELDFAALADIGWEVSGLASGGDGGSSTTHTIRVSSTVGHRILIQDNGDPTDGRTQVTIDGRVSTFANPLSELLIHGGSRNDIITIESLDPAFAAAITINAGAGNDRVEATLVNLPLRIRGDVGRDSLRGGGGNDTISGGSDNDSIFGNSGTDLLTGELGRDSLVGGNDNDTLDGGADTDNLQGDSGNDSLLGGAGIDVLNGGADQDILRGDAGNDRLFGGTDNDLLLGGDGNDSLSGEDGDDTLNGGGDNDTLFGGNGHDGLSGYIGDDSLVGDAGNDTLIGGGGNDRLRGGNGDDLCLGKSGMDRIDGEADNDTVAGGSGLGKDSRDSVAGNRSEINESFVFDAAWINSI